MRKSAIIAACLAVALSACTVTNIEISKAEHLCESKHAIVDQLRTGALETQVKCTDGKWYNVGSYNPHESP
jgi:hypothetical protein